MHVHAYGLVPLLVLLPCVGANRVRGRVHVVADMGRDEELFAPCVGNLQLATRPATHARPPGFISEFARTGPVLPPLQSLAADPSSVPAYPKKILLHRNPRELTRLALVKMAAVADSEMCDLDCPILCPYDREEIVERFRDKPLEVAGRLVAVALAYARVQMTDDNGTTLRAELGKLGPVFCKVGQTLATRPDIIGLETSRNLGRLQDAMAPEPDGPEVAMATLTQALGDDVKKFFSYITPEPVAAASLAEVYKATTLDGREVALKIQRPGLERKVALDFYVLQRALAFAQKRFSIGESVDQVTAVLDEVGNGIFAELDFLNEARNIKRFRESYKKQLKTLGVVVPEVVDELSSTRVLTTEWIDGVPPRDLEPLQRQALAKTAIKCLAMQLMTDGFIHCDPHEGNLIALPDGRVALIDFGLMAQMRTDHQEAMAHGIINIMSENYDALERVFKGMGVLSSDQGDLRRPGTEEPFSVAIRRCMTGGDADAAEPQEKRKKLVQDNDGKNRRRAFGQLYEELSELAFKYYFTLPSYYILVMRSFVTLEGIALSSDEDDSFNMYEVTAPYARRKLLLPSTKGGRALLRAALLNSEGRKALRKSFFRRFRRKDRM